MEDCFFVYHVVTDREMVLGQRIRFDEGNFSGVYRRVMEKVPLVEEIYSHPERYGDLEHHTMVALRELALEEVRREKYPQYPSRMACLYASETLAEAEMWCDLFVRLNRPVYSIVRLKVEGRKFAGDANNCFRATPDRAQNLALSEHYWENLPNGSGKEPIRELLIDGDIEVVEIVREVRANLNGQ